MKKIISGKVYNTETAREVGYASHGGCTSFDFYEETLYRKKTGEFFLYGSGNAASKYAEQIEQNTWSGGDEVIPLSYENAQKWAEENLDADDYEAVFGKVEEDDSRKTVGISISTATFEAGKRLASQRGISFSALIESLLEKEI